MTMNLTFKEYLQEEAVGNFNENEPRHVSDEFVRGGRPLNKAAIKELKGKGIQTVICLLRADKKYPAEISGVEAEKEAVEAAGMKFVSIDMDERKNPSEADINKFLAAVKSGGKSYAHCSAGRDRVGLMNAIYDMKVLHMSYKDAYTRYLKGGHDYATWTNLDKFFYKYAHGTPEAAKDAIEAGAHPADAKWLYQYITE